MFVMVLLDHAFLAVVSEARWFSGLAVTSRGMQGVGGFVGENSGQILVGGAQN